MIETRNSSLLGKITVLVVICCCSLPAQGKYGGGSGTPENPFQIFDANHMQAIGADANDWDKCFILMDDIDLSQFDGQDGREKFNMIGEYPYAPVSGTPFTGVFDGNGHTISNFSYTSTGTDYIGLFGYVTGEIKDMGLIDPNIDAGTSWRVGSLVGFLKDGTIVNCYAEGGTASGSLEVGGLVGHNGGGGTISNCYSAASVTGDEYVGGLVGSNGDVVCMWVCEPFGGCWLECWSVPGTILNCYSQGDVSGNYEVGGLVGSNSGTITGCYSTGSVTGTTYVGGLLGRNDYGGTITNCYSTGSVAGNDHVSGLVGYNEYGWVIGSFWDIDTSEQTTSAGGTGKTTAEMQTMSTFTDAGWDFESVWWILEGAGYPRLCWEEKYGGGTGHPNDPYLIYTAEQMNTIGACQRDWDKCFKLMADIDLSGFTGPSFNIIGYFVDWDDNQPFKGVFDGNGHTISNFTYTSTGTNYIGLFGYVLKGEIKDIGLIDPNLDAGTGEYVGSLVGELRFGTITGCYVEGGSVSGHRIIGGLWGRSWMSTITNCYSTSYVSGDWFVGGLVGAHSYVSITNCYSSGDVSGGSYVGGLAGGNFGNISDCYATGSVSGDDRVGGLVGNNGNLIFEGTITNCYSAGSVTGTTNVGGLVGFNIFMVSTSFWDIQTSGQTTSAAGTGLPTAEMQTKSTFTDAGWDFNTPVWTIDEGVDYPRLWWEFVPVLHAEPEVTLGTSNTISWEPVVGDVEYYAECSKDANFTSILHNSGWTTETSYEFTGLELGKRYWYSVKARNSAGIETNWSNVESSLQGTLADVVDAIDTMLDPSSLKNEKMKNALLKKIDSVLKMIEEGLYEDALDKLQNDILAKMNGCVETGEPDKNDWIITCEEQSQVYPLVIETIEYVKGLME